MDFVNFSAVTYLVMELSVDGLRLEIGLAGPLRNANFYCLQPQKSFKVTYWGIFV